MFLTRACIATLLAHSTFAMEDKDLSFEQKKKLLMAKFQKNLEKETSEKETTGDDNVVDTINDIFSDYVAPVIIATAPTGHTLGKIDDKFADQIIHPNPNDNNVSTDNSTKSLEANEEEESDNAESPYEHEEGDDLWIQDDNDEEYNLTTWDILKEEKEMEEQRKQDAINPYADDFDYEAHKIEYAEKLKKSHEIQKETQGYSYAPKQEYYNEAIMGNNIAEQGRLLNQAEIEQAQIEQRQIEQAILNSLKK